MVLKRLKLHHFFKWCGTNVFVHTRMGVGRGARIKKFQKKCCFLGFEWQKQTFTIFAPPTLEKRLEKNTSGPPLEKILPMPMHASMQNYIVFVKVVLHYTIYRQG